MVTGGVLYDLNENFVRSWEKIPMGISSKKEAEEFVRQRREIKRSVFKPDKTKGTVLNTQILCTQPEFGLEEIKGFYYRLSELSTSYLYIENQYFRWPPLAEKLAKWGRRWLNRGGKTACASLWLPIPAKKAWATGGSIPTGCSTYSDGAT